MDNTQALKIILSDIAQAKKAKKEIDTKIETWLAEYNGELYGNERKGYSKLVVKDIKKAVETFLPNAVEPFVKGNRIVKLDGVTAEDVDSSKMHERLLNYQFVRKFDAYEFIHDMFKVSATEGTVNIRTGWNFEEDVKSKKFKDIDAVQLKMITDEGLETSEVIEYDDGTYDVTAIKRKTLQNHPTARVIKNEDFLPDPSATSMKDAGFAAWRYESTFSELRASGNFKEEDLENLNPSIEVRASELANGRKERNRSKGGDNALYESEDKAAKKVTVYEYFGFMDIDGDGILKPIMATIVDEKLLELTDNPYPDGELPFVSIQFSKTAFDLWGEPMAEFLSDNQKIRTSLMRGIIDNVARSNNGKKFAKKGALDAANKRKYEQNLDGLIEFNTDPEDVFDGSYNDLPPSVFALYENIERDSEALSGVNRTMQGVDSVAFNDSATGAAIQQDMAQKRMIDIMRRHANGLEEVFRKWIAYNKAFLSDEEVMRINGEFIPFRRDDISGEFDINITVGTDGVAEAKVNQMTMLMQQVGGLADVATIPPEFFNMMLAGIADEWGYPKIATMLENPQPKQPSQMDIQQMQLQLEEMAAKVKELNSKAMLNEAKAIEAGSNANSVNADTKMNVLGMKDKKEA